MTVEGTRNWAREFAAGLVTPTQLAREGLVPENEAEALGAVKDLFDIRVPQAFLDAAKEQGAGLPASLALQVVPSTHELVFLPQELEDPIGDERFSPAPGLTHRYPDRALLKVTYQCASYCRFCFRRYKVSDPAHNPDAQDLEAAFAYLREHSEIREVILTGGDPLTLTDARLRAVCESLSGIGHIDVLRIHTRIPTVLPSRVTPGLIAALRASGKAVWVVAHVNAEAELGESARAAFARLVDGGVPVLAQTVLLKGVNDSHEALASLYRSLIRLRITPYYLHYPDLALGTGHFRVPLSEALGLVEGLRGSLTGFAIPRLVVDIPGGAGKVVVEPTWAKQVSTATWVFRSPIDGSETTVNYPD